MEGKIRLGILGIGNMGAAHALHVVEGKCPDFELAAVADVKPERLSTIACPHRLSPVGCEPNITG